MFRALTVDSDLTVTQILYTQESVAAYKEECGDGRLFMLDEATQEWASINQNTFQITVKMPNSIEISNYQTLTVWHGGLSTTIKITVPDWCSNKEFEPISYGELPEYLVAGQEYNFTVPTTLELDVNGMSWTDYCNTTGMVTIFGPAVAFGQLMPGETPADPYLVKLTPTLANLGNVQNLRIKQSFESLTQEYQKTLKVVDCSPVTRDILVGSSRQSSTPLYQLDSLQTYTMACLGLYFTVQGGETDKVRIVNQELVISLDNLIADAIPMVVTILYGEKSASINVSTSWCMSKTFSAFDLDSAFPPVTQPGSVYSFEVPSHLEVDTEGVSWSTYCNIYAVITVQISNEVNWTPVPINTRSNPADNQIITLTPLPEHQGKTFIVKVTKTRDGSAVSAIRSFFISQCVPSNTNFVVKMGVEETQARTLYTPLYTVKQEYTTSCSSFLFSEGTNKDKPQWASFKAETYQLLVDEIPELVSNAKTYNFQIDYGTNMATIPIIVEGNCASRENWLGSISEITKPILELEHIEFDVLAELDNDIEGKSWSIVCGQAEVIAEILTKDGATFEGTNFVSSETYPTGKAWKVNIDPQIGDLGSYQLRVTRKNGHVSTQTTISLDIQVTNCHPVPGETITLEMGQAMTPRKLFSQQYLVDYVGDCSNVLMSIPDLPSWLRLENYQLTGTVPNSVTLLESETTLVIQYGSYSKNLIISVELNCDTRNWQEPIGLDDFHMEPGEEVVFTVSNQLEVDEQGISWSQKCQMAIVSFQLKVPPMGVFCETFKCDYYQTMPTFVLEEDYATYKKFTVRPLEKDIGNYELVISYNSVPTITKVLKVATCSPVIASDISMTAGTQQHLLLYTDVYKDVAAYESMCPDALIQVVGDMPTWVSLRSYVLTADLPNTIAGAMETPFTFQLQYGEQVGSFIIRPDADCPSRTLWDGDLYLPKNLPEMFEITLQVYTKLADDWSMLCGYGSVTVEFDGRPEMIQVIKSDLAGWATNIVISAVFGDTGTYTLTVTQQAEYTKQVTQIVFNVGESDCYPDLSPVTLPVGQSFLRNWYSVANYEVTCEDYLVTVDESSKPTWMSTESHKLSGTVPNDITEVKIFNIAIMFGRKSALVKITVDANCGGRTWPAPIDEKGARVVNSALVNLLVGDTMIITLSKKLALDQNGVSWSEVCGYASVKVLTAARFFTLKEDSYSAQVSLFPIDTDFSHNEYYVTLAQYPTQAGTIAQYTTLKLKVYMGTCTTQHLAALHVFAGEKKISPVTFSGNQLECQGFQLTQQPSFVRLDEQVRLVIEPPELVSVTRDYTFYINDQQVKLTVEAPCSKKYIQGTEDDLFFVVAELEHKVVLTLKYDDDDTGMTWEQPCGQTEVKEFVEVPDFVTYKDRYITINPTDFADIGLHRALFKMQRQKQEFLQVIQIMVSESAEQNNQNMALPFFEPTLTDQRKILGESWILPVPDIEDEKYCKISKVVIKPNEARAFVQYLFSREHHRNIFLINKNAPSESVGTISISLTLSAYNQDHATYLTHSKKVQRQAWRWRRATYGFNLVITDKKPFKFLEDSPEELTTLPTSNITLDSATTQAHLTSNGRLSLTIYGLPASFDQLNASQMITLTNNETEVEWTLSSYESSKSLAPEQVGRRLQTQDIDVIFTVDVNFCNPWTIRGDLVIKICAKNCIEIDIKVPQQVSKIENYIIYGLVGVIALTCVTLIVWQTVKLDATMEWFYDLLLLSHLFTSGVETGALSIFNQQLIRCLTLQFWRLKVFTGAEYDSDQIKVGLYPSTSMLEFFLILLFVHGTVKLSCSCCKSSNIVSPLVNSVQIVLLTAAFTCMRYSSNPLTIILSVTVLSIPVGLVGALLYTAHKQGWWGLHTRIKSNRQLYPQAHQTIIEDDSIGKKVESLNQLEREFNQEEDRFNEIELSFGSQVYAAAIGFDRSILHLTVKYLRQIPLALVVVFVDYKWLAIAAALIIHHTYFLCQLQVVREESWSKFFVYLGLCYLQIFLVVAANVEPDSIPDPVSMVILRNLLGWTAILGLSAYFAYTVNIQVKRLLRVKISISIKVSPTLKTNIKKNQLFGSLSHIIWGSANFETEMKEWIKSRIYNFPKFYQKSNLDKGQSQVILQAAADLFFASIEVYTGLDTPSYIVWPRQLTNLNLSETPNTPIRLQLVNSKFRPILSDDDEDDISEEDSCKVAPELLTQAAKIQTEGDFENENTAIKLNKKEVAGKIEKVLETQMNNFILEENDLYGSEYGSEYESEVEEDIQEEIQIQEDIQIDFREKEVQIEYQEEIEEEIDYQEEGGMVHEYQEEPEAEMRSVQYQDEALSVLQVTPYGDITPHDGRFNLSANDANGMSDKGLGDLDDLDDMEDLQI